MHDISELNMWKQKVEQLEDLKKYFGFKLNEMKISLSGDLIFKNKEMAKVVYLAMKVVEVNSTPENLLESSYSVMKRRRLLELEGKGSLAFLN